MAAGDARSRRASRTDPCPITEHGGFGALCLGCAIEMAHEEAAMERESCAKLAETMGRMGTLIAAVIRERDAVRVIELQGEAKRWSRSGRR